MSNATTTTNNSDTCIIMPAYNEAPVVGAVIRNLGVHFDHIICVDDGSTDNSASEISATKAVLVQHPVNLGQGAALQTGLEYAKRHLPTIRYFVTFDSDGQHRTQDVQTMLKLLRRGQHDIVLGSRFLSPQTSLRLSRRLILKAGVAFTNRLSGIRLTDTHNGLRAFNRAFAEQLEITKPDMSHATEIIDTISRSQARWREVPVTIEYTDYSRGKGQSILNSINIGFDVLVSRLRK